MDFSITEEQHKLLADLDKFCEANLLETEIQQWLADGGVPDSFMLKYYREGFGPIGLPSRMGGISTPVLTRVLLLERLGFHAGATLPVQIYMNLMHFASDIADEHQVNLLRDITANTGKLAFSFAATEPQSGSDSLNVRTTAVEDEDGFVINGWKSFVSAGQYAPYIILVAHDTALDGTTEREPLTFFLVSRDTDGVDTIPVSKVGQHLIPTAEITFDNVRVDKSAAMGVRGEGAMTLLHSYEYGRIYTCATTVGMAQAAFDQSVSFAFNRKVSGASILSYQQIQDLIVDMQVKIDSMRGLLYKTACAFDNNGRDIRLESALLKRFVPKTAMDVADSAMQIMGSMGYLSTTKSARIWEECRGNRISEGTDQIMTVIAAKRIANREEAERQNRPIWRF